MDTPTEPTDPDDGTSTTNIWHRSTPAKRKDSLQYISRQRYIAMFMYQLQIDQPDLTIDQIEENMQAYDDQYNDFLLDPNPGNSPPLESSRNNTSRARRGNCSPTPTYNLGSPAPLNTSITNDIATTLQMQRIQQISTLTDSEKTIPVLKPDADIPTFLNWQHHVIQVLRLIPNFLKTY